jgi:hypothetical protein
MAAVARRRAPNGSRRSSGLPKTGAVGRRARLERLARAARSSRSGTPGTRMPTLPTLPTLSHLPNKTPPVAELAVAAGAAAR